MHRFFWPLFTLLAALAHATPQASASPRPNILAVIVDDLGYSDLGCYGGEIATPNIDRLADGGVRFTNFRVNPMCVVTRVSFHTGMPYYQGRSFENSVDIAHLLKRAGYDTATVGKWHTTPNNPYRTHGFDHFFGFVGGMVDSFGRNGKYFLDGERFTDFPEDFYTTDAFTDYAIEFMGEALDAREPFFMVLNHNAPHTPHQAPQAFVRKYHGRFDEGWNVLRRRRYNRMVEMGLIERDTHPLPARPPEVRPWNALHHDRKKLEDRRMAAYAGMVEKIDENMARVVRFLRKREVIDNTLILLFSDNGADYNNGSFFTDHRQVAWQPGSHVHQSNGWAMLRNTPYSSYKHSVKNGALAAPLIVHWPNGMDREPGSIAHPFFHVTDLYPTLLELAGAEYPDRFEDRTLDPLYGHSIVPILEGGDASPRENLFAFYEPTQGRLQQSGNWRAISLYQSPWELYNLAQDRTETENLAEAYPRRLEQLVQAWNERADGPGRVPPRAREPVTDEYHRWGQHRLRMISVEDVSPRNSSGNIPLDTDLKITFQGSLDFADTEGKRISLYKVGQPNEPIWSADPDASHPAQGGNVLTFTDIPQLEPKTHYFVVWKRGFARLENGGPLGPLNDGAFWWRFVTAATP